MKLSVVEKKLRFSRGSKIIMQKLFALRCSRTVPFVSTPNAFDRDLCHSTEAFAVIM